MYKLIVTQLDYDLTSVAGLALVGYYLKALQPVLGRLDAALPVKSGVANCEGMEIVNRANSTHVNRRGSRVQGVVSEPAQRG